MRKIKKPREFLYRIEVICKSDNGAPFYVPLSDFFHTKESADAAYEYFKSKSLDWYKETLDYPVLGGGAMITRHRKL